MLRALRACCWFALFAAAPVAIAAELPADFYVAPAGDDAWSGRLHAPPAADAADGPFATLARAQEAVRTLRIQQPDLKRPVVVAVRGGFYPLADTWKFSAADSGRPDSPTVFAAYQNERPVISGGEQISGWQVDCQGRWHAKLEDVAAGRWSFTQLFANDQRRHRPRLPRAGYYKIAAAAEPSPASQGKGFDRFQFEAGDLQPDWQNLRDVEVLGFHQWSASRMRIESIDPRNRIVTFTGATRGLAPWIAFAAGRRYRVENVREALAEPGQWHLDHATGELVYIPRDGETPENTQIVAPRVATLVDLEGDLKEQRWVEHIELRGLTFAHSNWELPASGQSIPQAEIFLPAAIVARGVRHCRIADCAVRHTGAYAIALAEGCAHNRIENCELLDLGAGGVKIGTLGGPQSWGPEKGEPSQDAGETRKNTVRNCTIAHGGRLHPAAVGVWIGHAAHNIITHNEIFDLYYTGISVGWQWGYAKSRSHHNEITFNHIHTIGQRVLSDMGGVYTLGISTGTVVSNNLIHDVQSFDYGGWGLYTDEGSTGITMENNLVYRTRTGGFHQHYGRDNKIANNIFAFGEQQQLQRTRVEPHTSFTFERNIVYWDSAAPLFAGQWRDPGVKLDHNIYWSTAPEPIDTIDGLTFAAWQAESKQDVHSRVVDPRFVDPDNGDFHPRADSPAADVGFVPFDYTKAGRETPRTLTKDLPRVEAAFD